MQLHTLHPKTQALFSYLSETYEPIQKFHFIGGTALALYLGHRESVDLDFVTYSLLTENDKRTIKNIRSSFELVYESNEQFDCFIDDVKVSLLSYRWQPLFPVFQYQHMLIRDLRDIVLSKASTIGRRSEIKDYIDLYVVLKEGHMQLAEIIQLSEQKFGGDFSSKLFLKQLLLVDRCEDYEIRMIGEKITKPQMNSFFEDAVRQYLHHLG